MIGVYDLLNSAKASATDTLWLGYYTEAYILAASHYFVISFATFRYSLWLKRHLNVNGHR